MSLENLLAFLTRLHHHTYHSPWTELLDQRAISLPESPFEAFSRLRNNVLYFRVNYLIILLAAVLAGSLILRPPSFLLIVCLSVAWIFFLYALLPPEQQLVAFHRAFTYPKILVGLILVTVAVAWLTVWVVIGPVTVGLGMVCVHGALRVPQDIFHEQQVLWAEAMDFRALSRC